MNFSFFKKNKNLFNKGFTLVELLITIVIFVMLTGVVLFNQKDFDDTILLRNLAYDVSLTIRQAQTYGINIKESQQVEDDFSSYGIYFNIDDNKKYTLFSDVGHMKGDEFVPEGRDGIFNNFDCSSIDKECIQKYSLKKNIYISNICTGTDSENCDDVDDLTVYFQRPDLNAIIYSDNNPGDKKKYAEIEISSANNSHYKVIVTEPGQIYVIK